MANELDAALEHRTKKFAVDCNALIQTFRGIEPGPTIARQLAKSANSVAANYRSSRRARSHKEFTARVGLLAEEADESLHWLETASSAGLTSSAVLSELLKEAKELTAIFSAQARTARNNERNKRG